MNKGNLKKIILFLPLTLCLSQEGEIVPLTPSVGTTLDAVERDILGLFQDIEGFRSAQFYEIGIDNYTAKIVSRDRARLRIIKKKYSWKEFQALKKVVKEHPEITQKVREDYLKRKSYRFVKERLAEIPAKSFFTIKLHSGEKVRGFFIGYHDRKIQVKKMFGKEEVSILDVDSIEFRPFQQQKSTTFQTVYFSLVGLSGVGMAKAWSFQSNPAKDTVWHHRFGGIVSSLLLGGKFTDFAVLLTTHKEIIYVAER